MSAEDMVKVTAMFAKLDAWTAQAEVALAYHMRRSEAVVELNQRAQKLVKLQKPIVEEVIRVTNLRAKYK